MVGWALGLALLGAPLPHVCLPIPAGLLPSAAGVQWTLQSVITSTAAEVSHLRQHAAAELVAVEGAVQTAQQSVRGAAMALLTALSAPSADPAEIFDLEAAALNAFCLGDFEEAALEHCADVDALRDREATLQRMLANARRLIASSCTASSAVRPVQREAWRVGTVDLVRRRSLAPAADQTLYARFVATIAEEQVVELECADGHSAGVTVLRRRGEGRWRLGAIGHN